MIAEILRLKSEASILKSSNLKRCPGLRGTSWPHFSCNEKTALKSHRRRTRRSNCRLVNNAEEVSVDDAAAAVSSELDRIFK